MARYESKIANNSTEAIIGVLEETEEKDLPPVKNVTVVNTTGVDNTSWNCYVLKIEASA